jgi:hypothetical protein
VVERFGVTPPVDLQLVAKSCADVEFDAIPGNCDGLVVGLHGPRDRPLILLDRNTPSRRQRFTLAHELGHVLLPWHLGDYVCDTSRWFADERYHAAAAEVQANRFAAHLLVPSNWLHDLVARGGDRQVLPLLDAVGHADVSIPVACLRLIVTLPPGFVFAIIDASDQVVLSSQSTGTKVGPPPRGEPLERRRLDRGASHVEESRYGTQRLIWWSYRGDELPDDDADQREGSVILADLLNCHGGGEAASLRQKLSGIIGYANSVAKREGITSPGPLYAFFRSRFSAERQFVDELLEDPEFDAWLRKRAEELGDT